MLAFVLSTFCLAAAAHPDSTVEAVSNGDEQKLKILIGQSPDCVNKLENGYSPVHAAARAGQLECLKTLIQAGGRIDTRVIRAGPFGNKEDDGASALHLAAKFGQEKTLKALIDAGAKTSALDEQGRQALHLAAAHGGLACVRLLVEHYKLDPEIVDDRGLNCLQHAATGGQLQTLIFLQSRGSSLKAKDSKGNNLLHLAIESGDVGVAQFLLTHGFELDSPDSQGRLPIHRAAQLGHLDLLRFIASKQAIDIRDAKGWTAFHYAVAAGAGPQVYDYLTHLGADPGAITKSQENLASLAQSFRQISPYQTWLLQNEFRK